MDPRHLHCCNGNDEAHLFPDNKHILVLVDANATHRDEVKSALISLYNIVECSSTQDAMECIDRMRPGAVLVADTAPPNGGVAFVMQLRSDLRFKTLPVVLTLAQADDGALQQAKDCGASGWLQKPYLRSALIKQISGRLNQEIEYHWNDLPALQAKALKGTVEMFNSLSDVIDRGEPIAYKDVNAACLPLVEAVNSGNYKGILNGVRDHDNYTYAHSLRVAVFLSLFGKAIGLSSKDQALLATGGLLHDVGKIFIPHLVLNKPGRLTEEEFKVMQGHVEASIKILEAGDKIPKGVITIAGQHHEKLDGSGYPRGLKGTELNELARMASIVDVFSALTDRRVYKPPMAPEKALAIMTDEMGGHLDMQLLSRFRQMLLDAVME